MWNRALAFSLWVTLAIPCVALSQNLELKPDDPRVHGEYLQPYTNEWRMKLVRPDGSVLEDAGMWSDQLESMLVDGRSCWRRTQHATFKRSNGEIAATTKTVNVFDARSLRPLFREFERHIVGGDDSKLKITFRNDSLKIETTEHGQIEVREPITSEAFDFYGGLYALLWVALPLKAEFTATFPSYTEDKHPENVQRVTYKIMGQEAIVAGRMGRQETWIVESDTSIGHLKYWISEKAPYIVRMDFKDASGANWTLSMT